MGIPRFAMWLSRKHPHITLNKLPKGERTAALYVDMNGLIHPCCHSEDNPSVAASKEADKIARILLAVDALVEQTEPQVWLHLAIDGVAPRAKMNQQRARRYMAAAEKYRDAEFDFAPDERELSEGEISRLQKDLDEAAKAIDFGIYQTSAKAEEMGMRKAASSSDIFLHSKEPTPHNTPSKRRSKSGGGSADFLSEPPTAVATKADAPPVESFDSNCISPGTGFLSRVTAAVKAHCVERVESGIWGKNLAVFVSGPDIPGEGEHKIVDFIRQQSTKKETWPSGLHLIHGLDADLVLLTLSLHLPDIYIFRDRDRKAPALPDKKSTDEQKEDQPPPSTTNDEAEKKKEEGSATPNKSTPRSTTPTPERRSKSPRKKASTAPAAAAEASTSRRLRRQQELFSVSEIGRSLVAEATVLAEYFHGAASELHKVLLENSDGFIDDFITLAALMGNDFMPRVPSAFAGECAMDNFMEVWLRHVLPRKQFIARPDGSVDLGALLAFFKGYEAIEAAQMRHFLLKARRITKAEASSPLGSEVDSLWIAPYMKTTTYTEQTRQMACEAYVQGIRFVWRYYRTTSACCSWSWHYPLHHGPPVRHLIDYLQRTDRSAIHEAPLETTPPLPFVQLLCILPPTSCQLLPLAFRRDMLDPPKELKDTFPLRWSVDWTEATGQGHLATPLLSFANQMALKKLVSDVVATSGAVSAKDLELNANRSNETVILRSDSDLLQSADREHTHHSGVRLPAYHAGLVDAKGKAVVCVKPMVEDIPELWKKQEYGNFLPSSMTAAASSSKISARDIVVRRPQWLWSGSSRKKGLHFSDWYASVSGLLIVALLFGGNVTGALLVAVAASTSFMVMVWLGIMSSAWAAPVVQRNIMRDCYCDWLCPKCNSLNFGFGTFCYSCRHPFNNATCCAIFSSKIPHSPPLMDTDHAPHREPVAVKIPDRLLTKFAMKQQDERDNNQGPVAAVATPNGEDAMKPVDEELGLME